MNKQNQNKRSQLMQQATTQKSDGMAESITLYQIILFMTCFCDKTESSCRDTIEPGLFSSGGSMVDD